MAWPGGDGESGDGESTLEDPAELQRQLEQQQHERLNEAGCLDGFKDVILDALPLIDDLFDSLTWRSMGLQRYRAVVAQAAKNLNDESWREFVRKSTETIHKQDDKVFDRLMTDAEPLWRRIMEVTMAHAAQAKRQGSNSLREYLYICTSSPSRELLEFFHGRSWRAVVRPPRTSWQAPKAGTPEGPTGYPLAIVDLSFPPASEHRTTISVMEEEEVEELEECETEVLEDLEEPKLKRSSSRSSSNESKMPPWLAEALVTKLPSMEAHLAQVPLISSGLGKIGVTRSGGMRRRFFAIQQALAEALRTLAPGGVLVISWCGLAVHPILPFLAHSLRPAFRRVHVLCPPDTETFETYILAADFDSDGHPTRPAPSVLESNIPDTGDDPPAAISKFAFFDWLRSPLRRCMTGYDDAVAWTISQRKALEAEVLPKYQHSANNVRRMSNYNRPWLTAMTGSESKANLDPEARCDEMWSLYAEKLRILAERLEEGSVPMELLPPKPAYRNNATTRWGLAASRLPIDLPSSTAEAVRGESKAASKTRSGSKRSGSKRPKSKEPPPRKTSKSEPAAPVPVSPPVVVKPETSPVEMRPVETAPPVEVTVPKVEAIETSSATDSSSADVPPVVPQAEQPNAEVVQDVELPQESQFSEDDFFRLYGEQNQDSTTKVRRPKIPATVSGRLQGTMWMSSTLGGASGLGPDILSMMRRSSLLKGAFEKINLANQSSLPDLYRAAWPMPKPKTATSPGAPRPHSGQSRLMAPAPVERRPHSTASTRRPKPVATLDVDRPFSAGTGPKKGPKRAERKRR